MNCEHTEIYFIHVSVKPTKTKSRDSNTVLLNDLSGKTMAQDSEKQKTKTN